MNRLLLEIVYVNLLDEGTDCSRPTNALKITLDTFKLLPTENYDPEDEVWEFVPGTVVRCVEAKSHRGETILLAVEKVG